MHVGDISKEHDVQDLFIKARDAMGGCNVLINNAGLHDSSPLPPLPLSVSIAVGVRVYNLYTCMYILRFAVETLISVSYLFAHSNIKRWACVLHISTSRMSSALIHLILSHCPTASA